ncbi:unnamed protein product [Symbiodinium natans]|uniref:SET domain-containing protein n=1 Tax=Symbiodinium natans TaxID=878477 RepID=A0A812RWG3_9DINO|nr:unnamed protein product [Symbiodinium natans]
MSCHGGDDAFDTLSSHVCTYHGGSVSVAIVEGKGRVLLAERDFEAGERILLEYPLIEAVAGSELPAVRALRGLHEVRDFTQHLGRSGKGTGRREGGPARVPRDFLLGGTLLIDSGRGP